MTKLLILLFAALCIVSTNAWNRQNHFGNPCYLCKCFIHYSDRDVAAPIQPYSMAIDGYDTTEDRCLATCLRDKRCYAAVYGMVGGRNIFTCEFYEKINTKNAPYYTPYVNMYMKRASNCTLPINHLSSVEMIPADDSSVNRRKKQMILKNRKNPFLG